MEPRCVTWLVHPVGVHTHSLPPPAQACFVDQAPLQNVAADWKCGSTGCYDIASLTRLQCKLQSGDWAARQWRLGGRAGARPGQLIVCHMQLAVCAW